MDTIDPFTGTTITAAIPVTHMDTTGHVGTIVTITAIAMAITVVIVVIGEEALARGAICGSLSIETGRNTNPSTAAITNAIQLTQTGIGVRPIVTGQPANARKSCRIATMAKIAPAMRA
ncbi:MAG: hypothetical protein WAO08_34365 [Hyphomicrobiaceae bacterium]